MGDMLHVLAIGNAIVDVIGEQDDAFLAAHGLEKGTMQLVSADTASLLYERIAPGREVSGGSAANTAVGVAALGGRAGFIGRVADDHLGHVFARELHDAGVTYTVPPVASALPTGRSLIIVTPDGERTMNTALGISAELAPGDVDGALVKQAEISYFEGYLWDSPTAVDAARKAMRIAHAARKKTALALSDAFCVERHRSAFLRLAADADIVIANEREAKALFSTDDLGGVVAGFAAMRKLAVVTRSAQGAIIISEGERIAIAAEKVAAQVDATGAGDLFAAGFLLGVAEGRPLRQCGQMGAMAGAEAVTHFGARPEVDLKARLQAMELEPAKR